MAKLIPTGLVALQRQLEPVDKRELALAIDATFQLWRTPENWASICQFYIEVLSDVPRDLALLALKRLRAGYRFETLPKPADLRAQIEHELTQRHLVLARLRVANIYAGEPDIERGPATPEEREAIAAMVQTIKTQLGEKLRSMRPFKMERIILDQAPSEPGYAARVAQATKGFQLPTTDDPRVAQILKEMGET